MLKQRYAILTVDTEALPKRASSDHVTRLMWGEHPSGCAGVREFCSIGSEFGAQHVFFVDLCGAYSSVKQVDEVVKWIDAAGHDVQLHTHPEYLPQSFWTDHNLEHAPRYMNNYSDQRAEFIMRYFSDWIKNLTGKPVLAHRAGSFRWNASAIRALQSAKIPLSFNNSMCAVHAGQCVFSEPTNQPYMWSNGVIEVPTTEKKILPKVGKDEWWARLTYPESGYFRFNPWWGKFLLDAFSGSPSFSVFLLHSWSLLYWDENGHATYKDDKRLEGYRKLLSRLTKDYDVITTADFLDLHARGKIKTTHTVDLSLAEFKASAA